MTTESQILLPVLRVLSETSDGVLTTGEIRKRVKGSIALSAEDLIPLANRSDCRIDQVIRNLKSHKTVPGNPFCEGLLRDVPRGYKITELGRRILKSHSE